MFDEVLGICSYDIDDGLVEGVVFIFHTCQKMKVRFYLRRLPIIADIITEICTLNVPSKTNFVEINDI
mgnify:CR=1 FL=1